MHEVPTTEMKEGVASVIVYLFTFILLGPLVVPPASATEPRTPQTTEVYNPAGVRPDGAYVDRLLKQTMVQMGKTKPSRAGEFADGKREKVSIRKDAFSEINELFYNRGWTDGLPAGRSPLPPAKP